MSVLRNLCTNFIYGDDDGFEYDTHNIPKQSKENMAKYHRLLTLCYT